MADDDLAAIEGTFAAAEAAKADSDCTNDHVAAMYETSANDVPFLLAEVRRLRAENEELLALSGRVNEPKAVPCAFEGCTEQAVRLACGRTRGYSVKNDPRHPTVASYCNDHAAKVALEGSPEYVAGCPHCGCAFGV